MSNTPSTNEGGELDEAVTVVTSKGQTTIPQQFREKFGIAPGERVVFRETAEGIIVDPAKTPSDIRGAFTPDSGERLSDHLHAAREADDRRVEGRHEIAREDAEDE